MIRTHRLFEGISRFYLFQLTLYCLVSANYCAFIDVKCSVIAFSISRAKLNYVCACVCVCRFQSTVQISKLQDLVNRSKLARCRGRFVCPVILYNGKVLLLSWKICSLCSGFNISDGKLCRFSTTLDHYNVGSVCKRTMLKYFTFCLHQVPNAHLLRFLWLLYELQILLTQFCIPCFLEPKEKRSGTESEIQRTYHKTLQIIFIALLNCNMRSPCIFMRLICHMV